MSAFSPERGESPAESTPASFEALEGRVLFAVAVDYLGSVGAHAAGHVTAQHAPRSAPSTERISPSAARKNKVFNYWPAQTINVYTTPNQGSVSFAVADLNGDGREDMVFNTGNGYLTVLIADGHGNFLQVAPIDNGTDPTHAHTQYTGSSIVLGSFTGGTHIDLAVSSYDAFQNTSRFAILPGNGDGTFGLPITQSAPAGPLRLFGAGDTNNDGANDLIASVGPQSQVLLNDGAGNFSAGTPITVPNVTVSDFNSDGLADIVAPSGGTTNNNGPVVRLGLGDGTFGPAIDLPLQASSGAMTFTVADFNKDNSPDLIATDTGATTSGGKTYSHEYYLAGRGNGTFGPPVLLARATNGGPSARQPNFTVSAGDFNGDGSADLVTLVPTFKGSHVTGYTLNTLLGNGNGKFHNGVSRKLAANDLSVPTIHAADIDLDGKQDVIIGGLKEGQATIFYTFYE